MIPELKENISHGTREYPYSQHYIHDFRHAFQIPVHWHEEVEIIYVKKGTLQVMINEKKYIATERSVFFVNPRELHLMGSSDPSVAYHTLLFPLEFISFQSMDDLELKVLQPLRRNQLLIQNEVSDPTLLDKLVPILDEVITVNATNHASKQMRTRILLLQLLLCLLESQNMLLPATAGNDSMQKDILAFIQEHYTEKLSLSMIAQQFHLSEKYLSRYFKEHFYLPFSNYVIHLRLTAARQLLETTELSVTEIALHTGFSNISYFIRSFKATYGMSPLRYRKEIFS